MRLIWTSDPASTYKDLCRDGEVVGLILGLDGFVDISPAMEEELVQTLRKFSAPKEAQHG